MTKQRDPLAALSTELSKVFSQGWFGVPPKADHVNAVLRARVLPLVEAAQELASLVISRRGRTLAAGLDSKNETDIAAEKLLRAIRILSSPPKQ